jgi:hypothetical protein
LQDFPNGEEIKVGLRFDDSVDWFYEEDVFSNAKSQAVIDFLVFYHFVFVDSFEELYYSVE